MARLKFYEVDADYIKRLTTIDSKVPRIDYSDSGAHDKFLCGVVLRVAGHNYFAPVSSFNKPQRSNFIILDDKRRPISSLRFSYMIPIPPGVATLKDIDHEEGKYRRLLNLELRFINENATAIFTRAKYVYDSVVVKKDPGMIKNCCDFKVLEAACAEYAREHPASREEEKPSVLAQLRTDKERRRELSKQPKPEKSKRKNEPEL